MANKTGKAYAFFDSNASKGDIERELPFIRQCVKTPSELELSLMEGVDSLTGDTQLLQIARKEGRRYVMEATYPNATNHQTADEVASILNQAYQAGLYEKGKIVYKDRERYLFRR